MVGVGRVQGFAFAVSLRHCGRCGVVAGEGQSGIMAGINTYILSARGSNQIGIIY